MSGFASRRRRASRDGGKLRDPGDREGQLRVGAADERLDALLEEARATSMPPAVKRVGGVPAAADGRRTSAAAGRADGGRQPPLVGRQERGAGWQETVRQSLEVLQRAFGPKPVGPPPPEGLLGPLFHGRDPGHPRADDPGQPGGQGAWQREAASSPQFPIPPRVDRSSMNGEGGPQPRVLEPYDMSTPHQHGRQQTNPFWSDRGRAPDVASRSERPQPPSEEVKRSPTSQELEAIRERILREAHLNFEKEVKKLTGGGGSSTFESANSVGERAKLRGSTDGQGGNSGDGVGESLPDRPPGLHETASGTLSSGVGGGAGKVTRIGAGIPVASTTEALRNLELPSLPAPNGEGASILFGDWLTMAFPLMADISNSAKAWWEESLMVAQEHYSRWLRLSPLERLRSKPQVEVDPAFQRIEQRGIAMLLGALPDQLRRDLVSGRQLSVVHILYRLHVAYQPGGGAEKTQLLKNLVESKFFTSVGELLMQVRLWRRWLSRAQELHLNLPDPLVLMHALQRMIDSTQKAGGTQVSFRISNVRQELRVDYAASLEGVTELAEYVQAEIEEMSLTAAQKGGAPLAQPAASSNQAASTSLKAMASSFGAAENEERAGGKLACKFWKSEEGCRRGTSCTYAHDTSDMKNRCFGCGGNHMKRECPHQPKTGKTDPKRVSKVKATKEGEKGEIVEKIAKEQPTSEEPSPGSSPPPTTTTSRMAGTPEKPLGRETTAELLSEATSLLKTLRSMKVLRVKELKPVGTDGLAPVGLLDGGATNGLRRAHEQELERMYRVRVELASGSATLFRVDDHKTLLSKNHVEVIVPLHRLVGLGYRLQWTAAGVKINHPVHGRIDCALRGGCPVLPEAKALELLSTMEKADRGEIFTDDEVRSWWSSRFPEVPAEVWEFMKGQDSFDACTCPWNRRQRRRHLASRGVIVNLFAGKDYKSWSKTDWGGFEIVNVDVTMGAQFDLHGIGTWGYLCHLARRGLVVAVLGGPPCRTVSRLRHRAMLEGLSSPEQELALSDCALMMKQIGLWLLADEHRGGRPAPGFLMESPRDPMDYMSTEATKEDMPSFWNFEEVKKARELMGASLLTMDQGPMGHVKRKPTCLMVANLPQMKELDGVSGEGRGEVEATSLTGRLAQSREWSSWAPGLVAAVKECLKNFLLDYRRRWNAEEIVHHGEPGVKRMSMESWKTHVRNQHQPYRRDCRRCMELMGVDAPHRRTSGDRSAYCLSYDILGPMPLGDDVGLSTKAKYMVATVAIPKLPRGLGGDGDHPQEDDEDRPDDREDGEQGLADQGGDGDPANQEVGEQVLPQLDEVEDEVRVAEEDAAALNEGWRKHIDDLAAPVGVQNITLVEPLESRGQHDVTKVATRMYCRFKAMGLKIIRVHTDRECAFFSKVFQSFCRRFGLYQTMTGGDEGPSNGRIETEVQQVKRRLRMLVRESGLGEELWPGIARYVGEERLRHQCVKLGVPCTPLMPIGARVTVKTKRWHRAGFGPLIPPFRTMTILGPSPFMTEGYVLREGQQVQHARVVVLTDPMADRAVLELQEASDPSRPSHRVMGKQPPDPCLPQIPAPRLSDDPHLQALQAERGLGGEHKEIGPARHFVWSGGESLLLKSSDGGKIRKGDDGAHGEPWVCGDQREYVIGKLKEVKQCRFCETPFETPGNEVMLGRVECEMNEALKLRERGEEEHWSWKRLWSDLTKDVVVGEDEGTMQGYILDYVEKMVLEMENKLTDMRGDDEKIQIAAMAVEVSQSPEQRAVHSVLQTYTVPLAQVRKDLPLWIPPLKNEVTSLETSTTAVRPVKVKDLVNEPGYEEMLVVPSKVVPTVKAPDARKKARIVLCGNLVEDTSKRREQPMALEDRQDDQPPQQKTMGSSFDLYASGIDGMSLRCTLRKAAQEKWSIGVTDVSTAFLLAPRKSSRLMVTKPPSILVEAGLIEPDIRWVIEKAVYGLDTSPSDWQAYRDEALQSMRWWEDGVHNWVVPTPEPNVWRLMTAPGGEEEFVKVMDDGSTAGYALSYVDDFIVTAPRPTAERFLKKLSTMWKCAEPKWVTQHQWLKFCGIEMRWKGDELLVGQPDYTREIVSRYPDLQPRQVPLPKLDDVDLEDEILQEDVKKCQTIIGELLWLSTRTRPDLSFAVSYLGSRVTKCPKKVLKLAHHVVGYLMNTLDYALAYKPCSEETDSYGRQSSMSRLEVLADSSFAPTGGKGHQGIMCLWGGALVAWESKTQPFATLSTTECELLGYVDGLTLGESVGAIVNVLEQNALAHEGCYVLRGDNLSGLQLLHAPSGPWRTRHLRLRSHVLRERLQMKLWHAEHIPGADLCADLLTKAITVPRSWESFASTVGLVPVKPDASAEDLALSRLKKLALGAAVALGLLVVAPGLGTAVRAASVCGLAALTAFAHKKCSKTADGQSTKRSNASHSKETSRWSRENEPGPASRWSRENEPGPIECGRSTTYRTSPPVDRPTSFDCCRTGTPRVTKGFVSPCSHGRMRMCAMKAPPTKPPPRHVGLGTDEPWELARFMSPPTGLDRWECLGCGTASGDWWVRVLKRPRVRQFHPLHRGTPVSIGRLSPTRITVAFSRGSTREAWRRRCIIDDWVENRNSDVRDCYEWCGYTFFFEKFGPEAGAAEGEEALSSQAQMPLRPGAGGSQPREGYGGDGGTSSHAAERGRKAVEALTGTSFQMSRAYDGTAITARVNVTLEGVPGSGYEARRLGCLKRGEIGPSASSRAVDLNEEAWRVSLESERLSPPEADDLPIWMGVETPVVRPPGLGHDSEDSRSVGSFELLGDAAEEKTCSGSP